MNSRMAEIAEVITNNDRILITAHVLPDGDSIGSVVGLGLALESLGKEVYLVMQDKVPDMYCFLPGTEKILFSHELSAKPRLAVFLDCSDISRVGDNWIEPLLQDIPVINIDHHVSNEYFGTYNYVDAHAAATAEIVYSLVTELNVDITKDMASALYTGMVMDTGSFQYQNTTRQTFITAASLLEKGVDLSTIRENIYESKSLKNYRLISAAIDNLQFGVDGKVAWTYLDQEIMKKLHADSEHCEGIVSYPISLENVKIGLFFREMENGDVKVGLRCRSGYDVNKIALQFGGGGHQQAAGCTLKGPLHEAINKVIKQTEIMMEEI
ncbi:MAG: bifunctional oligoribonuclease/PAP phosphatase NrnA [Dehalobacterium sp.]